MPYILKLSGFLLDMMKNRDWHKDISEIPGLQKAGYRHRDSGVASPRFLHIH